MTLMWEELIYVQRHVLNQGSIYASDGAAICSASSTQDQPRLTTDGNGGAYIVWMDERFAPFPETEIYMQHISASGHFSFEQYLL